MGEVLQLGYVGVVVSDVGGWREVVEGVVGMRVEEEGEGGVFVRMDERSHRLILHEGGEDDVAYIGWQVEDEEALERVRRRVEGAGVELRRGTRQETEQRRVAAFYRFPDVEGNVVEVFWGPQVVERPFSPGRAMGGFKTGSLGMGHVVLRVGELERAVEFYRDVVGMRVRDYIHRPEGRLVFFYCNGRHHSLALGEMAFPKRMHHVMVEVRELDDVGRAYDLCLQRGLVARSLGRHINDHMVSFYLKTPSGFFLEYGWGGRVIEGPSEVVTYHTGSLWGHHVLDPMFLGRGTLCRSIGRPFEPSNPL